MIYNTFRPHDSAGRVPRLGSVQITTAANFNGLRTYRRSGVGDTKLIDWGTPSSAKSQA